MPHLQTLRAGSARVRRWLALCALAIATPAFAQTGTLAGTVVDADFGDPLPGVNVVVEDLGTTGAATDFDGRYRILSVPAGTYTIAFSSVGFQTQRVTGVEIRDGETTTIDLQMGEDVELLGDIIVEARIVQNTDAALLAQRAKAVGVSDAVSLERISRSGASDASDALKMVPGVSVQGGRGVIVRGLSDRYVNAQLNGATLPSADPDKNAVPLDLFPSSLLDNIVTSKTFTADQPGTFTGGSVNVVTRDFPEDLRFSVSASTGWNSNVAPGQGFLVIPGGSPNALGSAGSGLLLPQVGVITSSSVPAIGSARGDLAEAQQLNDATRAFSSTMAPGIADAGLNQSYGLSIGNQVSLFGRPLGFVGGLNYGRSVSGFSNGIVQEFRRVGDQLAADFTSDPGFVPGGAQARPVVALGGAALGVEETTIGALANLSYRITDRNTVGVNVLYSKDGEAEAYQQSGYFPGGTGLDAGRVLQSRSLLFVERELLTSQLRGRHALSNDGHLIEWTGTLGRSTQDEPDFRIFENDLGLNNAGDTLYTIDTAVYDAPTRYFRGLEEWSYSGNLDVTAPVDLMGRPVRFKFGGTADYRDRSFRERRFNVERSGGLTLNDVRGDVDAYFADSNTGIVDDPSTAPIEFGTYLADLTADKANYDGTRTTGAGYAMADFGVTAKLRAILGARVEYNQTEVYAADTPFLRDRLFIGRDAELSEADLRARLEQIAAAGGEQLYGQFEATDVLPSASFVYALSDDTNLRATYGRTVALPTFREIAPYSDFRLRENLTFTGNVDLVRTTVNNMDLRWEWFARPGEIFAASVFAKQFNDPIELTYNVQALNPEIQPRNVDNAFVAGAELEARRRLDVLPGLLGNLEVGGNLTVVTSSVSITEAEQQRRGDGQTTRQLAGQSPYVVNLDLGYADDRLGLTAGLFYNVFGERLYAVSVGGVPDLFEQPRQVVDFVATQRLPRGFTLKLAAKNLLNDPFLIRHEFGGQDYVTNRYTYGRTFSAGISYSL